MAHRFATSGGVAVATPECRAPDLAHFAAFNLSTVAKPAAPALAPAGELPSLGIHVAKPWRDATWQPNFATLVRDVAADEQEFATRERGLGGPLRLVATAPEDFAT